MKSLRIKDCIDFLLEAIVMFFLVFVFCAFSGFRWNDMECIDVGFCLAIYQFCVTYAIVHIRKIFNKKSWRFLTAGVYTFVVAVVFGTFLDEGHVYDDGDFFSFSEDVLYTYSYIEKSSFLLLFVTMLLGWFIIRYEIFQHNNNNNNKVNKTDTDA